jgi:crotonobetainyl-CoA:carnitine CoA-transferase CaiB-like acyl-CoA transferase
MMNALRTVLDGYSVVALVTNIPGPLAAARLRQCGALVTKIEPLSGDPLGMAAPRWYASLVEGVRCVPLDLRSEDAKETLSSLLSNADVLITATRASVLERLGLHWDRLHAMHPNLVHVALSGELPPHDSRAGHDLTYQARAGTIAPPSMPRALIGDMAAAERAVAATFGALLLRERTGRSTRAEISIVEAATDFAEPYRQGLTAPDGALGGGLAAYGIYAARDGYVAVAALEPHFVERLRALLGVVDLTRETIAAALAVRNAAEWERDAIADDIPLAAIR